jgi:hypothetical protein
MRGSDSIYEGAEVNCGIPELGLPLCTRLDIAPTVHRAMAHSQPLWQRHLPLQQLRLPVFEQNHLEQPALF